MNRRRSLPTALLALCTPVLLAAGGPPTEPQAPETPAPKPAVTVDTSEVPDLEPWAEEAKDLVEAWYPKISGLLASDGFTPPGEVKLVFKKDMRGVAETSRNRITIAASWVKRHPEDKGMVIHELTHVIQSYPPSRAGWLVEGIADYVRFYRFEPDPLPFHNPDRASYRDGYRTTARFLDWVERTHGPGVVARLNAALRAGRYTPDLFVKSTSKDLDALWADFLADVKRPAGR